jgi:two-component system OmpR family sensor kinase
MIKMRWYQSLYWRIALGLFLFLALMLTAQSVLLILTSERIAGSMPARSPRRLALLVASDIAAELSADRNDLQPYVRDQFGHIFHHFLIIMRDGRTVTNHAEVPEQLLEAIPVERARLERAAAQGGRGARRPPDQRTLPPEYPWESAGIFVDRNLVGTVAVLSGPPTFTQLMRAMGPTIGLAAALVLGLGTALIAFFVFGPARGRLRQVQLATERLGSGDLSARAPEHGRDEVAVLAHSFNAMADELANRASALEEADRTRRQLLADVSHELLTPLTAMRGYLETLTMPEVKLDQETRARYLSIIDDETHRLERIVGDLLDLARLEGGGTAMRREPVHLDAVFERVRSRHERESAGRGIQLLTSVGPNADLVEGDPDRLEQAFQNLAANALRHTPDGGAIVLSASANNGAVHVQVRDSGPGIPADHLPRIFERFYKADTSRKAAGGSGLGLSIVKAIVEGHGGRIAARNDAGAVFEIELPKPSQHHATQ